jgi:hypothetical protein
MSAPAKTTINGIDDEVQRYIASNYVNDAGEHPYVVDPPRATFTLEDYVDVIDLERIARSTVLLTMFWESGTMKRRSNRGASIEATFRFMAKGSSTRDALHRARTLLEWLENKRTFETSHFRVWVAHTPKMPSVVGRNQSGSYLSDFSVTFLAFSKI